MTESSTLPALPDDPGDIVVAARSWLHSLRVGEHNEGIVAARDGAATLDALRAAHRRAGASADAELAYAEAARHAERRLGQLLTEARDEGKMTGQGTRTDLLDASRKLPDATDLGISVNLAADAALFAQVDDVRWEQVIALARAATDERRTATLSRGSLARATRDLLQRIEAAANAVGVAEAAARRANETARREVERLRDAIGTVSVDRLPDEIPYVDVAPVDTVGALVDVLPQLDERKEDSRWSVIRVDEGHPMVMLANKLDARLANLPEHADSLFAPGTIHECVRIANRMIVSAYQWATALSALLPDSERNPE